MSTLGVSPTAKAVVPYRVLRTSADTVGKKAQAAMPVPLVFFGVLACAAAYLNSQQAVKERTIALERDAQIFRRDIVAPIPLTFQLRAFLREDFRQPFHG